MGGREGLDTGSPGGAQLTNWGHGQAHCRSVTVGIARHGGQGMCVEREMGGRRDLRMLTCSYYLSVGGGGPGCGVYPSGEVSVSQWRCDTTSGVHVGC